MTTKQKVTAGDILLGIRRKHSGEAVVREAVIDDPAAKLEWNRYLFEASTTAQQSRYLARPDWEMAEELPGDYGIYNRGAQRRIDALILGRGRTAVEIKVTRADFRSETERKRRAWRAVTHRFVYAAPVGVIPHDEVPAGCGLWEFDPAGYGRYRSEHGLTVVKRAKTNKDPLPLPDQLMVSLAHRVGKYEWRDEIEKKKARRKRA